ncbi:MAG: PQQ-binding-like beta-propeller repeat protein [Limisphaerales bacterium]
MKMSPAIPSLVLLASLISAAAAPGDWPTWRGPKRDGISTETGLLKQWPAGGPPLAWKIKGCGTGYSSVSVADGRVITMGDGPDGLRVVAFSATDGKPLWQSEVIGRPGGDFAGGKSTPTIDEGLVYVLGQFGDLVCLEAKTGKVTWKKSLTTDFGGRMQQWNFTESPLVDGNKLLATPGGAQGTMVALDKKTGATLWQSKQWTDAAAYSSIVPSDFGGKRHYVQLTERSVAGVDAATGALVWRAPRQGATAVVPTPILSGDLVFVTSGYNIGCNLFKLQRAGNVIGSQQSYANRSMVNHHGGVILLGQHLYGHSDNGDWTCMDLRTGAVAWKNRGVGKGAVAYADGHLYCRSESGNGTVALVAATPTGYQEKGRFDQPDRSGKNSWAHSVIAGGKLYLRDMDVLLCYDVKQK